MAVGRGVRVGAATFAALGLSFAGPQALGVATADSGDGGSAGSSAQAQPVTTPASGAGRKARVAGVPGAAATRPAAAATAGAQGGVGVRGPRAAAVRPATPVVAAPTATSSDTTPAAAPVVTRPVTQVPTVAVSTRRAAAVSGRSASAVAGDAPAAAPQGSADWAQDVADAVAQWQDDAAAVLADPVGSIQAALHSGVDTFFDTLTQWSSSLPANPISDYLSGALLLVRRSLFDEVATTDPSSAVLRANGLGAGSLNPVDPMGEVLTYTVTDAPAHGSVQINTDGSYVYTPDNGYTGTDSFTVNVDDPGFDLFDPLAPRVRAVTVGVAVTSDPTPTLFGLTGTGLSQNRTVVPYTIYNMTGKAVYVQSITDPGLTGRPSGLPTDAIAATSQPVGSFWAPGDSMQIDVYTIDKPNYSGPGPLPTPVTVQINLAGCNDISFCTDSDLNGNAWKVQLTNGYGNSYSTRCDTGQCVGTGAKVTLLEPVGTTYTITSAQPQEQAEAIQFIFTNNNSEFKPTAKPRSFVKSTNFYSFTNSTQDAQTVITGGTESFTATSSFGSSFSSEVGASIGIDKMFEIAAKATFGTTKNWQETTSKTTSTTWSVNNTVMPGYVLTTSVGVPSLRATGIYTAKIGNTTYILKDVYFDFIDPSAKKQLTATSVTTPIVAANAVSNTPAQSAPADLLAAALATTSARQSNQPQVPLTSAASPGFDPPPSQPDLVEFKIYNMTGKTVYLQSVTDNWSLSKPVGSYWEPGDYVSFRAAWGRIIQVNIAGCNDISFCTDSELNGNVWNVKVGGGTVENQRGNRINFVTTKCETGQCTDGDGRQIGEGYGQAEKTTGTPFINLLEPVGTTYTITSEQPQEQAEAIDGFFSKANSYFFPAAKPQRSMIPTTVYSFTNSTQSAQTVTTEGTESFTATSSFGRSTSEEYGLGLLKFFGLSGKMVFGQNWEESTSKVASATWSINNTVMPGYALTTSVGVPSYRAIGTYTAKLGNTTYILEDVFVDFVDPSAKNQLITTSVTTPIS